MKATMASADRRSWERRSSARRLFRGWSKSETFEDPRHEPFGPLPAEQAKYRGLYISGDRVVFSYTLGGGTALELPGLEGDGKAVSRTIQLP